MTADDIAEMIFFPVVNEACRCLAEGVVVRASDLDVASILGMGFPRLGAASCTGRTRWAPGASRRGFGRVHGVRRDLPAVPVPRGLRGAGAVAGGGAAEGPG